jgi:hypothetical protein
MKSTTAKVPTREEIDSIVDGLLADPSRADDVKGALRARFSSVAPDAVLAHIRAVDPVMPVRSPAATTDDDDLWENVPV